MEHSHHNHNHSAEKNIGIAFFINFGFTVFEIIGGIYSNSLSILSDALHDLGDCFSLGLSWYFERLSRKGPTQIHSYGYKRFSLLGAFITAVILLCGSALIILQAIPRFFHAEPVKTQVMIPIALIGIAVNSLAMLRLWKSIRLQERIIKLHLLEDVLGWIAVLITSIVIHFFHFYFLDPLLSIGIMVFILFKLFGNFKQVMRVFLQSVPSDVNLLEINQSIKELPEIADVHDTHIWSMDGNYHILTTHIVLNKELSAAKLITLKQTIKEKLANQSIQHSTIEFEQQNEICVHCD